MDRLPGDNRRPGLSVPIQPAIAGRNGTSSDGREPGRYVLTFHVDDARSTAAHLDRHTSTATPRPPTSL